MLDLGYALYLLRTAVRQAGFAIAAVFLGIELLKGLDPDQSEAEEVLTAMASLARLFEGLIGHN